MIQTAEGALNEVHDMLQRMSELTIRGLNETLTVKDREYVQEEIDQLYDEIVRTSDTTTFNGIEVLNGNPFVKHKKEVDAQKIVTDISTRGSQMPSNYVSFPSQQTLGGASLATQSSNDGTAYRMVDDGGNVVKQPPATNEQIEAAHTEGNSTWSPTLSDNYGITMDFSQLANTFGFDQVNDGSTGVSKYRQALEQFAGTGFYTTCGTCSIQYNVVFVDDQGRYTFLADKAENNPNYGGVAYVNIQSLYEDAEKVETQAQAQELTQKFLNLIVKSAEQTPRFNQHFIRFATSDSEQGKLFLYDYRDYSNDPNSAEYGYTAEPDYDAGRGIVGSLEGTLYINNYVTYTTEETYYSRDPINIQYGDDADNCSSLDLPNLSSIFDVYKKYGFGNVKQSLTLQEKIPATSYAVPGQTITTTHTREAYDQVEHERKWIPAEYYPVYNNGEVSYKVKDGTGVWQIGPEQTKHHDAVTWTETEVLTTVQIETPESYGPLNRTMINVIDDLIGEVNCIRSYLGSWQNRLEHTYNNNLNAMENMQSAESKIRDTDMSEEMVKFSNQNIIQQAGQAILAQANKANEYILGLLQ